MDSAFLDTIQALDIALPSQLDVVTDILESISAQLAHSDHSRLAFKDTLPTTTLLTSCTVRIWEQRTQKYGLPSVLSGIAQQMPSSQILHKVKMQTTAKIRCAAS
jgi:hypothetical protein